MPKAARARVASPPAGTALAPAAWECLPGRVRRGEVRTACNYNSDNSQWNGDITFSSLPHLIRQSIGQCGWDSFSPRALVIPGRAGRREPGIHSPRRWWLWIADSPLRGDPEMTGAPHPTCSRCSQADLSAHAGRGSSSIAPGLQG